MGLVSSVFMRGMFVFFLFVACFHDYDVFDTTRVGSFESQRKRLPALCRPLVFCSSSPSRFRSEIRNIDLLLTKLFIPAASSFVAIIFLSMLESRLCPLSVYPNPCSVRSFFLFLYAIDLCETSPLFVNRSRSVSISFSSGFPVHISSRVQPSRLDSNNRLAYNKKTSISKTASRDDFITLFLTGQPNIVRCIDHQFSIPAPDTLRRWC